MVAECTEEYADSSNSCPLFSITGIAVPEIPQKQVDPGFSFAIIYPENNKEYLNGYP